MQIPDIEFQPGKGDFEVVELEKMYRQGFCLNDPEQPHRVKFYNLIYIEQGCGKHMVDFVHYNYCAGSFIFLQPEQVHAFDFSQKPQGKMLIFTQAFLDQVHVNMRLPNYTPTHLNIDYSPYLALDESDNKRVQNMIGEIITERQAKQTDPLIVMYLFSALSLFLHRLRPESTQDKISQQQSVKFAKFITLLFAHFHTIRDANWYANNIHTTYKTLNMLCKVSTNLTAKQLIDAHTIVEIKRRLFVSNVTTQQMATDFCFDDASNFVKYFKKHTSLTPSQFVKKHRELR
ncbi:AraC family transcriptional regulator [Thalassotalea sp. PLHSN55]|uniref:AraC family transcriptional regulator n=1 Tax=Thalassotalea sp. PLHSN55 TaxID=3435888 RepID=UPI003F878964